MNATYIRTDDIQAFVDVLIPGENAFPSASSVNTHVWLLDRLDQQLDSDDMLHFTRWLEAFAQQSHSDQIERVLNYQEREPIRFRLILRTIYLGYYQSPTVLNIIRTFEPDYRDTPLPDGYALDAPILPAHDKGHYIATDAVKRIDLSQLDSRLFERSLRHDET